MTPTRRPTTVTRELGMAMAVLALWMLSLLAPLHQTSGLLREMAKAGHDISGAWSICVTLAQDADGQDHAIPVCPAQAIGKSDLAAPPPGFELASFRSAAGPVLLPAARVAPWSGPGHSPLQPRAPPAAV